MFFDTFSALCSAKGVSTYRACTDIGLNRSAVAKWKTGSVPNGATAAKLADYFGVSVDVLLGKEDMAPRPVSEEEIKFALFGGTEDITDEMYEEVKSFAAFVRSREKRKKE